MKHVNILLALILALSLFTLPASADEPGRTSGPEQSEFGQGGYSFGGAVSRFYLSPAFGSGIFEKSAAGDRSGLLYGVDLGYERDEWIGLQAGYAYLPDRKMSIYSLGARFAYNTDPFVYYISTGAGLYHTKNAGNQFGLAPGAGIDILVNERIRVGLNYKHDFIFTDPATTHVDRIYAGLKFYF